jgi:tubulin-specific chaperone A
MVSSIFLTDTSRQTEEGRKGPESSIEQLNAGKDAISKARTAEREIA